MHPGSLRAGLVIACLFGPPYLLSVTAQQVVEGTPTILVTILASPKGPVTDLTAKDFKVQDGSKSVGVTSAQHATSPLAVELIVENTQPTIGFMPPTRDLRAGLEAFVKAIRAGNQNAQIGMFTDAGAAQPVVDVTASAEDLDKAINRLAPAPQSAGVLLEALVNASHALAKAETPRRAIVTVDFAAPDPTSDEIVQSVESAVFQSGATLWSVSVAGTNPETPARDAVLSALTKATGGERESINESLGLQNQLKAIANSLVSQYTLHLAQGVDDIKALKIDAPKGKVLVSSVVQ